MIYKSSMVKSDAVYIQHILDAISRIETYVAGMTESGFLQDSLRKDAVVRQLEIIGEAARALSEEGRTKFNNIPWPRVVGMRNRLIHEYFDVSWSAVWQTATEELKELKAELSK